MTACAGCGAPIIIAAAHTQTFAVNPQPDPTGNLEVRRWHRGWDARRRYGRPARPGWAIHTEHQCGAGAA